MKVRPHGCFARARATAVDWMLRAHSFYGFSSLTALLAVDFLDRFLSEFHRQGGEDGVGTEEPWLQPWMPQLTGVACLSLAAKVEETQVPLLLDLQVEESRYVFEAKTVQKMELLVLSMLQWRMNPETSLSFVDYFARRLGLKGQLFREFVRRSELVILNIIPDPRFSCYRPSVMAAAVMLQIMDSFDHCTKSQYQDQLLCILPGTGTDVLDGCCNLVTESAAKTQMLRHRQYANKRKFGAVLVGRSSLGSPSGVINGCFSCSSDSECSSELTTGSFSPSPGPPPKKGRFGDPPKA
ncbi:hypothetical protein MLD38_001741 [Melastoma candidum]|uniref:Uncharacterized protein n=1 Tax=Melastoma candidum TaxID=119954 RepID=A0ACB9SI59_9MYRT|nr:hypothetical protein MLD38_001741 [Melastoma candidum]